MQQNLMQLSGVDLVVPTHGLEGAKAYPLGLNSRVPLFDDTEDVFYIKSTDANGFPTVKKYRFWLVKKFIFLVTNHFLDHCLK